MATYHALLIGIDAYDRATPLYGSVNDVDAFAKILEQIAPLPLVTYKLVAPHKEHRALAAGEDQPTRARVVSVIKDLIAKVTPGDRVLIYYCGHGTSEFVPEAVASREALVPVDFNNGGALLWDLELGGLLDQLYATSRDLTVILDACHSAGATRIFSFATQAIESQLLTRRRIVLTEEQHALTVPPDPELVGTGPVHGLKQEDASRGYTVVAAAHSFQAANEMLFPEGKYGLLSHAIIEVLKTTPREKLPLLRWADIWARICGLVWERCSRQHPAIIGPRENRVLGGPPGPHAEGILVRSGELAGTYDVDAGELVGAGVGARLVVYPELPASFPPPGSPADQELERLGEIQIESATEFTAVARPVAGTPIFEVPDAACARIIAAPPAQQLKVLLGPELDPEIADDLRASASEDGLTYVEAGDRDRSRAEATLGQYADGSLWLGDPTYGPGPDLDPASPGPLVHIPRLSTARMAAQARTLLLHYADYVVPLRLARRSDFSLSRSMIEIEVIPCADKAALRALMENPESGQPLPRDVNGRVRVKPGDDVAFAINNTSPHDLHFVLLGCTSGGKVERMDLSSGSDVGHESRRVLGMADAKDPGSGLKPFKASLPRVTKMLFGVDRLVAFVTNHKPLLEQMGKLVLGRSFADVLAPVFKSRVFPGSPLDGTQLVWTAASLEVQIGAPLP